MSDRTPQGLLPRTVAAGALSLGLVVGGYGIASAASGADATTAGSAAAALATTSPTLPALSASASTAPQESNPPQGWGGQRSDETVLTGDALSSVTKAAQARVPGGTIVRVETDADGNAAYEAHMTTADGSLTTVYVDKSFNVVSVESR